MRHASAECNGCRAWVADGAIGSESARRIGEAGPGAPAGGPAAGPWAGMNKFGRFRHGEERPFSFLVTFKFLVTLGIIVYCASGFRVLARVRDVTAPPPAPLAYPPVAKALKANQKCQPAGGRG